MTPSQLAAFEGILEHGLRLVWGPPGTGKTHFLALADPLPGRGASRARAKRSGRC